MKTTWDAVKEAEFNKNRYYFGGNQHGQPINKYKCFVCGDKDKEGAGICSDCRGEFPVVKVETKNK